MLEILGKTNIDFMGRRRIAFTCSGVMVLLGLLAVVQIARGAANLGIDFAARAIDQMAARRDPTTEFRVADAASFTTSEKFDVIIFNESLYYFRQPISIVERYLDFLAGDGIIIVSMEVARNRVAIWNTIGAVLNAVDETTVFNGAGLGWTIKAMARRSPDR